MALNSQSFCLSLLSCWDYSSRKLTLIWITFSIGWNMKSREIILIQQASFQRTHHICLYVVLRIEHGLHACQKNPVSVLKELSAMKSRYQSLYARFKPVVVEQKETKSRIYATLNKTMTMIEELQKQTDLELSPLTEEEKTVTEQLKSHITDS
ncbi:spindle and kinetochore-associated protein 2 isoform X2 [Ictidomys tridecemlineatus]